MKILKNQARCMNCNSLLVSEYLGDYRNCSCGQLGINGGRTQLMRQVQHGSPWVELSIMEVEHGGSPRREAGTRSDATVADAPGDGGGGDGRPGVPAARPVRRQPKPPAGEGE